MSGERLRHEESLWMTSRSSLQRLRMPAGRSRSWFDKAAGGAHTENAPQAGDPTCHFLANSMVPSFCA